MSTFVPMNIRALAVSPIALLKLYIRSFTA